MMLLKKRGFHIQIPFFAEVPIKRVLLGLGKWFKKFARINGASYQLSGKKINRSTFP